MNFDRIRELCVLANTNQTALVTTTTTLTPTATSTTNSTTSCSNFNCSIVPSFFHPFPGYQYERLTFNCTSSFSNFTLVHVVQRLNNETYSDQYDIFWAGRSNKTFVQSPSALTFIWRSLPGTTVQVANFPLYTEIQFYYNTNGSMRYTRNDTWTVSVQSLDGNQASCSGTF
jgi:hypothetical protein